MRIQRVIFLSVFILFVGVVQAQTTGALYINSPVNGARVDGSFVRVQFGLTPGVSAAGIPAFRVQVDRQSPMLITDTECILNWLSPGWHTVSIALVDANGIGIFGAQNQVQFYVRGNGELP